MTAIEITALYRHSPISNCIQPRADPWRLLRACLFLLPSFDLCRDQTDFVDSRGMRCIDYLRYV
jgi:hypothetical protein